MNKRGFNFFPKNKIGSHVGTMLSFVIFITFIIFLYSILQPALKTEADKEDMVDYLNMRLKQNFSSDLTSIALTIDPYKTGAGASCITVPGLATGIEQPAIGLNRNWLVVKNSSDSILSYFPETNGDLLIKTGTEFDGFLKAYSSKDIDSSICASKPSCGMTTCYNNVLEEGITYQITTIAQTNETFLKKARAFKTNYELSDSSYEKIKEMFDVPENIEFGFELKTFEEESINTTRTVPEGANVYVRETPILYVDENATLESGFLTVKVW